MKISSKGNYKLSFYEKELNFQHKTRDVFYTEILNEVRINKIDLEDYYERVAANVEIPDNELLFTAMQFDTTEENYKYFKQFKKYRNQKLIESALCYYYNNTDNNKIVISLNNSVKYFKLLYELSSIFNDTTKQDVSNAIYEDICKILKKY